MPLHVSAHLGFTDILLSHIMNNVWQCINLNIITKDKETVESMTQKGTRTQKKMAVFTGDSRTLSQFTLNRWI